LALRLQTASVSSPLRLSLRLAPPVRRLTLLKPLPVPVAEALLKPLASLPLSATVAAVLRLP